VRGSRNRGLRGYTDLESQEAEVGVWFSIPVFDIFYTCHMKWNFVQSSSALQ
jgi:hypothetical protein